jgi:cysteine-rich repeat protein
MILLNRYRLALLTAGAIALTACASPAVTTCGNTGIYCPAGTHCAAVQGICLPNENTCGDGVTDPDERCDDGNVIDNDQCAANCKSDNSCGNDKIDTAVGEQCDPPDGTKCSKACRMMGCGNDTTDTEIGEICDPPNGTTCSSDRDVAGGCRSDLRCGNGITDNEVGEVCDPPKAFECSPNCRSLLECGDGNLDPGEECDNGSSRNSDDADCRADCVFNRCGDGRANTTGTLNREGCDSAPRTPDNFSDAVPTETAACNIDCTVKLCGDGKTNATAGEQCDDGTANNQRNNNCTEVCKLNVCGDGRQDTQAPAQEQCDDGNQSNGDGCSNACTVRDCGNNIVDQGEECDDGNADDTDGCSNACLFARCGDGIIQVGEQCDGGNTTNGDGCSSTCRFETCGNGLLDPGEECDHGVASNDDRADCRSDCVLNRCGDGFQHTLGTASRLEACDAAPAAAPGIRTVIPTEAFDCNLDCSAPSCGDGKINRHFIPGPASTPEQCDNVDAGGLSLNSNAADCTAGCQVNTCGDGRINTLGPLHVEACDDGNRDDRDTCTNACAALTCGDGIVGTGEQCDLGTGVNADTGPCLANCKLAQCGDGKVQANVEQCDSTPGCSATCQRQECGNGIIDPDEDCDSAGANSDSGDCRLDCRLNRCGDGHINVLGVHREVCDDGPVAAAGSRTVTPTETATCNVNCTAATCGDGIVNRHFIPAGTTTPEECDNLSTGGASLNSDTADCTATCHASVCGDNLHNTAGPQRIEACDDGNRLDGDACTNGCVSSRCGDGILGPNEQCDLGSALNSDTGACLASCLLAGCGDGKVRTGVEECDGGPGCSPSCRLQQCGNGIIDPEEQCDSGAANSDSGDCRADCVLNRCGDGHVNTLGAHPEPCDGGPRAAPGSPIATPTETAECNLNCTSPACGDGITNHQFVPVTAAGGGGPAPGPEQCDDGQRTNSDGCSADCQFELCGNTILDFGEECDGQVGAQPCSDSCRQERCGNGITEPGEGCDDGGGNGPGKRCNASCGKNICGDDDLLLGSEQCDDGNLEDGDTCEGDCTLPRCGNGIPDVGEACDDGNPINGDGCDTNCTASACGNAITDPRETCDDGNTVTERCPYATSCQVCDATCQQVAGGFATCGDGQLDPPFEVCDDHNTACGACSADCRLVTTAAASGLIVTPGAADLTAADSFTIDDGFGHTVSFQFADPPAGAPASGATAITIAPTNVETAAAIVAAVNASTLFITATQVAGTGIVRLTHRQLSSSGNRPITEDVASTGFAVLAMTGGLGGDCVNFTACSAAADCISNRCVGGACAACTSNADCTTGTCSDGTCVP